MDVENNYLRGYAKTESGDAYTRNLCRHVYRRVYALPKDTPALKTKIGVIGANLGFLTALGLFDYRPGTGRTPAYLAYGPAITQVEKHLSPTTKGFRGYPGNGVPGVPKKRGTHIREFVKGETSKQEQETVKQTRATPVTLTPHGQDLLTAITDRLKGVANGQKTAGLMTQDVATHNGAIKQLNRNGHLCADAQAAGVTSAFTVIAKTVQEKNDLTAFRDHPLTLLAKVLAANDWAELLAKKKERLAVSEHYEAEQAAVSNGRGRDYWRAQGKKHLGVDVAPVEPLAAPLEPVKAVTDENETPQTPVVKENDRDHTQVPATVKTSVQAALDGVAAATAFVEMLPAYLVKPPLQGRIIADAVAQAKHLGGVFAADAERLHAVYLARRADSTLWAETDLAVLEKELGRCFHLAEVAMYGLRLTVNRDAWQQAEQGGSQPVNVSNVVTV
jgi:hypothetical protein